MNGSSLFVSENDVPQFILFILSIIKLTKDDFNNGVMPFSNYSNWENSLIRNGLIIFIT
jgi:hypothetical protein